MFENIWHIYFSFKKSSNRNNCFKLIPGLPYTIANHIILTYLYAIICDACKCVIEILFPGCRNNSHEILNGNGAHN